MTHEVKTDRVKTGDPAKEVRTAQPRELVSLVFANSLPHPMETSEDLKLPVKYLWKGEIDLDVQQGMTIKKQQIEVELRAPEKQNDKPRLDIAIRTGFSQENWVIQEDNFRQSLIIRLMRLSVPSVLSP